MSTKNKPSSKSGFWKDHSSAWKLSELTQQAYCEQAGISYRHFEKKKKQSWDLIYRNVANYLEKINQRHLGINLILVG